MSAARRAAACAAVIGIVIVGCGSGPAHGRSATDSSGVVALSSVPAISPPASAAASPPASAAASASNARAGTATALAEDHWSTVPPAPITARSKAASAWTGRQLLIWGGAYGPQGDQLAGDGAAYDPTTKRWTKLPAAPISARSQMASVWTGSELFVWGGDASDGISDNGALYNPSTTKWQKLPPSPLSGRVDPQAVWVDGEVIVISGDPPAQSSSQQVHTDLAAFNPVTNKWTTLAPMPLVTNQLVLAVVAVATNNRLYAWEEWQHAVGNADGSGEIYSGIDLYIFDPTSNSWSRDVAASRPTDGMADNNSPGGIESALWTGTDILVPPPTSDWCGDCPGPGLLGGRGDLLNPSTNTWTQIPAGPIDDFNPGVFVWTGAAVIDFNTSAEANGPSGSTLPGQAAAWDPVSGAWTRLPAAPLYGGDVDVWDGDGLLEWGTLYIPAANSAVSSDTTGVQFGPDP